MRLSSILGLNARSQLFAYRYNTLHAKKIADSKLKTFRIMKEADVATPEIYKKFKDIREILDFDWESLSVSAFALKPSKGLGGEGIIVIKKRSEDKKDWITTQRKRLTQEDLKLQAIDIVEGAYSMTNEPDTALVQEYVGRHNAFRKYAYRGTPDIRIIVFNKVPVMAMLRLPTKESGGRANIHQGAIGLGVDVATGIITRAIWHGEQIVYKPGTKRKLRGIKIPDWPAVLETAVRAQIASGLGYLGVDIVLHPEKGPMVLEINAQPGLQIQMANNAGLKKRLDRVEDLVVRDAEHGVKIARALFAEKFADRVRTEEGIKIIGSSEEVKVRKVGGGHVKVLAKIDTGAWNTSIDKELAKEMGLFEKGQVLWYKKAISSLGEENRPVINITFWLSGRKIKTTATVADRSDLTYKMIVGRANLGGFLVNPNIDQ